MFAHSYPSADELGLVTEAEILWMQREELSLFEDCRKRFTLFLLMMLQSIPTLHSKYQQHIFRHHCNKPRLQI